MEARHRLPPLVWLKEWLQDICSWTWPVNTGQPGWKKGKQCLALQKCHCKRSQVTAKIFVMTSNLVGLLPEGWVPVRLSNPTNALLRSCHPRALAACPLSGSLPGHSSVAPGTGHLEQRRAIKLCKAFNAAMFYYTAFKTVSANNSVNFIKSVGSCCPHCGRQIWGFLYSNTRLKA